MKKTFLAILFIFFTTFSFALEIGDKAPNFKVELSDGKQVSLSDYKGKYLFLHFWATWCGPCRKELPELQQFYQSLSRKIYLQNERIEILTKRSIRDKLLKYFNTITTKTSSKVIYLPFSYTDLADYLSIDRTAIINRFHKNLLFN